MEWEENNFLYPLRVLGWIWKLNWERQRNREKYKCCLEFSHVHGSLHKKMKTQKSIQGRKLFIAFGLKKKNSVKNEWTRDGEELTRRIRVSLTRFVCQVPHLCSWERLLSSYYGEGTFHMGASWSDSGTRVWEEGQCDLPAFLKFLQLKLYNVSKCSVSWTPSQTMMYQDCLKDLLPSQKLTHLKGWTVLSSLVCFRR